MTVNLTIKFAGHRGYKAKEIENSRSAFFRAIKEKLDYVEFDVRKTSDHIPILFHDKKLNRLILAKKGNIKNYTLEDLKSCFYPDGQRILTLEEFFSLIDGQVNYILDLKVKGIENKIIELIRRYNLEKRIIIQTQYKKLIKKLYKLAPDLDYALYRGYMGDLGKLGSALRLQKPLAYIFYSLNIKPYPIKYLSSDGPFLYQELTSLLNKKGIKIILGSIRTYKYIKNIKKWNVDIITCDHVEYIRSLLKSYEKRL